MRYRQFWFPEPMSTLSGVTGTQTTTDSLIIDSMMSTDRVVHPSPHVLRLRPSNDLSLLPLEQSTLEREQAANAWQGAQIAPEDALRYRQEIDKADRGLLVARKQSLAGRARAQHLQAELDHSRQLSLAGPAGLGVLAVGLVGWFFQRRRVQQLQAQVSALQQQQQHTGSTLPSLLSEDVPG